ncbi:hypothetical protein GCM10011586_24490 [Silvibacterium dinghuense]|nr:hypothetical protein GCM10011586_24490 [Silvibacterium dinghuense]
MRDILELACGYLLILAVLWTDDPWQRVFYWIALAVIAVLTLARRASLRALGLTRAGVLRSLWIPALALGLALVAGVAAAYLHTLHRHIGHMLLDFRFAGYLLWAFVQQFLLQNYFLARLRRIVPARYAAAPAVLAALLFALAHLPNPLLTTLTLAWGWVSCILFLRYRNLYTLGLAHAILGITIALTVPNHVHHHMRAGLGYLHYHPHRPAPHGHETAARNQR